MPMCNYKKYLMLIAGLCKVIGMIAQPQNAGSNQPPAQLQRNTVIDIKHIAIDLQFDWAKKQALGTTSILFSPLKAINKINLDAGRLTIGSVVLEQGNSLQFKYDGGDRDDGLEILLDKTYPANSEITIRISYHTNYINEIDPGNLSGANGKGLFFSQPSSTDPIKPKEVWSIGDAQLNRYWFPCYDSPDDLRTTELRATVDKKLTLISNGNLISKKNNGDGTYTFHYACEKPYANHLTSFVAGEYVLVKQQAGNTALHNYGSPYEKDYITASTVRLPDMMNYFSRITGLKYPYKKYTQVFVQYLPNWTGHAGMSTITENMVDDAGTHADFFYLWDLTEAEALAHQWFGYTITAADWSDVWLNKSFAHYFNCLYNEYKNGKNEFLIYQFAYDQSLYLNDWYGGNRHPVVTKNYDNVQSFTSDNYATFRGAQVLHMLRKHLGEEKWWKAIRLYVKKNAGKLVTTTDFIRAVNEVNGEPMDWFFEQWLYKTGHPIFEITQNYDSLKKDLTITARQTQLWDTVNTYPQADFFKGKIDILIDGKLHTVWMEAKEQNVFTWRLLQKPKLVTFDHESTWIKEVIFSKTIDELLYQLQNDKDILSRQWALNEIATCTSSGKMTAQEKDKIKHGYKKIITGTAYWRLRMAVLWQLRRLMNTAPDKSLVIDTATKNMILQLIKKETSWLKASAIGFLGASNDSTYADLYSKLLQDKSDRVVAAAALALGKTKSHKAFPLLKELITRPSMKSQSLLSALGGLKELQDKRAFDLAYRALADSALPRWRLPVGSVWDYRVIAAGTIAALKMGNMAYPLICRRFKKALEENDKDGIFNNVLLVSILGDPSGQEVFEVVKMKYKDDSNATNAINQFEIQFKEAIKKN
jgi:aminopeptidase N